MTEKWKTISDDQVRHIWAPDEAPDGEGEISVNPSWYAENGTVYNEADEEVRIVLLHDSGGYSNLPHEIAVMIVSALNSR